MPLSKEMEAHILSLYAGGYKQEKIAELLGISQPEVSMVVKKHRGGKR